ncbi:hypothetical protein [Vannielia sp.]|uniref:hypothetical protein n=1 Tax=Vannielia sp. TaxID=2813045 RepID=UPI00260C8394|nr:hypothetical protein [Vannielia sp.]MDF1872002.1 hypothetical protein [Vannielia sp.]|tara:strand:+ start:904 stop:1200 length:297 start_codon:yes stop_codon:yes gene_type:complete
MGENTKRELTFAEVIEAARRVDQYSRRLAGHCTLHMDSKEGSTFWATPEKSPEGDPYLTRAIERMNEAVAVLNAATADNPSVRVSMDGERVTFNFKSA